MSFTDLLRSARSKPIAVLHRFLTNYDPQQRRVYAFVEGTPDEAFYRAHIQGYESNPARIFLYNCEGKKGVYDTYSSVVARYPDCTRVFFFVDKDLDDIVGKPWPQDPRICVTDCYAIENYLAERDVLFRFFDDYVKIRRVSVDMATMTERFDDEMRKFHKLVLSIMAWIVIMRRAGHRVILTDVTMADFFQITDSGIRRKRGSRLPTLQRVTKTSSSASWREIRKTCRELQRLPAKRYVRGKFEAWWFVEITRKIVDTVAAIAKESGGSISVNAQLNENSFIQLLARAIPTPPVIDSYLRFHLATSLTPNASATSTEKNRGILSKLRRLIGAS